jgi:hypothetical protein
MIVRVKDLKLGDRVVVRNRNLGPVVGTVTEVAPALDPYENDGDCGGIKNGMSGIGYQTDDGADWWCYEDQIVRRAS